MVTLTVPGWKNIVILSDGFMRRENPPLQWSIRKHRIQKNEVDEGRDRSSSPNVLQNAGGIASIHYSQQTCQEEKPQCTFKTQFVLFADKHN